MELRLNMTKKQTTTLSVLILTAFVLGALVCGRFWFRLDLTKDKLYTISDVSRNLYNEIPDQVQMTYYLSDKLKAMHPLPGEIEDLLREYTAYSRGKIRLSVKDPVKADLVGLMEQVGIIPQQIQTMEQDQASVMTIYSGVVIEYLGMFDVLPWVFALETLEYDLTSRIRALVQERSRQIGVIAGDNPRSWSEDYQYLQSVLYQAGYRFRVFYPGEEISDTLPALFVLGGTESLTEGALYQIDRYIQTGGKVFFSVRSVAVNKEGGMEASLMFDYGLLEMISSYGVTLLPEIAMDNTALTMQYQTRTPSGAIQIRFARNPQWIRVSRENGNPEHPVGARFGGLDLFWANPLTLNAPNGVTAGYLFTSTQGAWSMREPFLTDPGISYLMERDFAETKGEKILGASLTGIFPSWFAGKPKPSGEEIGELPDMPDTAKPARIIVVGETDFLTTFINATGSHQNLNFIVQVADWLSNDDDIIGIRNRGTGSGRLDRITDPVERIAAMRAAQAINVFIIPLLVILAGVLIAVMRRRKAQSYSVPVERIVKEGHDDV
jgi:ABC-type uncharacterized transport system involved in gliding motility auxiliary subunit